MVPIDEIHIFVITKTLFVKDLIRILYHYTIQGNYLEFSYL